MIAPMFAQVLSGEPTSSCDQLLLLTRNGYTEEAYFTWSYSPIRNLDGSIEGILTPIQETTGYMQARRRKKIFLLLLYLKYLNMCFFISLFLIFVYDFFNTVFFRCF